MLIVKYRKIFYVLSGIIVTASILAVTLLGVRFGIEFTGGAITEVSYTEVRPQKEVLDERLATLPLGGYSLRPSGESGYILRTRDVSEAEREGIVEALTPEGSVAQVERFASVGPTIGSELKNKALVAIVLVLLTIIAFVAFVFRKVSEPVSSFYYGAIAILALLHDILVPVGIFSVLGYFLGAEIDVLFITALLAILGYSVNDTIVVFDRVRENLRVNKELNKKEDFEITVGKSLNQTFTRSVNTSLTTVLALLALFFFGGEVTQNFALVLIAGIIAGTYSSIAIATSLLVSIERFKRRS